MQEIAATTAKAGMWTKDFECISFQVFLLQPGLRGLQLKGFF